MPEGQDNILYSVLPSLYAKAYLCTSEVKYFTFRLNENLYCVKLKMFILKMNQLQVLRIITNYFSR